VTALALATPSRRTGERGLIPCLAFAALTGSVVAGLGSPIVLQVSQQRHVSISTAQWTLIITLLVGVIVTPIVSRFSDGRLRRGVLIASLATVSAGALVGAAVPTFPGLLAARALQGLGYAMVPLTVSIARERLSGPVLNRTLGILSTSIAVGVGLGNPVMGLCVMLFDYRAAFLFAFLVSTAGAFWVWRSVPPAGDDVDPVRPDLLGAVLLGVGLGAVLLAVSRGDVWGWPHASLLAGAGGVVLALWVLTELRTTGPLIDLRLSVARGVLGVNIAAVLLGVCVFGGAAIVMLFIQRPNADGVGFGASVFVNGLLMTPMAVMTLVSPPIARAVARVVGTRGVLPVGSFLVAASFAVFAVLHDHEWQVALVFAVMGVGIGIAYAVMPNLIVARTPVERTASATGVNQILRLVGGAVGAAACAALLTAHQAAGGQPAESGYVVATLVSAAAGLVAAVLGYLMVPPVRDSDLTVDTVNTAELL